MAPGKEARYNFDLSRGGSFRLRVTPCGGTVSWRLTQRQTQTVSPVHQFIIPSKWDSISSDVTSQDNVNFNEIVTEPPVLSRGSYDPRVPPAYLLNRDESLYTNRLPESPYEGFPRRETVLVQEVGCQKMEYFSDSLPQGTLHFYAYTDQQDAVVRVFATTQASKMEEYFPKLPPRRRSIVLTNVSATEAHVEWEHSPSVHFFERRHIEYCLALSKSRMVVNFCEFSQDDYSSVQDYDTKSNRIDGYHGGIEEEKRKYTEDLTSFNEGDTDLPLLRCVKYKTNYHFAGLSPNTEYKLSLFAHNKNTGGSTSYKGLTFRTLEKNIAKRQKFALIDSELVGAYLNPSRTAFQTYEFLVSRFQREVLITVQPCTGYVRVNLFKDKKLLKRSVIGELRRFVIARVTPGFLRVKIANDDNTAKVFKIWASTHPWRDPYPRLPEDTSIKVFELSRGCRQVTLAWLASKGFLSYCLYKKMEEDDYFKRLILEDSTECRDPPSKSLIECRVHSESSSSSNDMVILNSTVHSLMPGTTYRFDLFVQPANKPVRQTLVYRTVWVKTKRKCT